MVTAFLPRNCGVSTLKILMTSMGLLLKILITYWYAFSLKRATNLAKALSSMALSRILGEEVTWGWPFVLTVEPTNICNLKCPLCPSGAGTLTRPKGTMGLEEFQRIIDDIGDYLILLLMWNQGEPLINREFTRMVRYAKSKAIPVITSTNGHFLKTKESVRDLIDSGLDEIIVSLDGACQQTYSRYRRGGSFETVVEGVRLLCEEKRRLSSRTPTVHLQFIVMRHNEDEIEQIGRLAKSLGVDKLSLKTAQVYSLEDARKFLPSDERYSRYRLVGGSFQTKSNPTKSCKQLWYRCVVNWDGSVSPCCFDKDARYSLGNVFERGSLKEIWAGRRYRSFRNLILPGRERIPMCRNCSEGLRGSHYSVQEVVPTASETSHP